MLRPICIFLATHVTVVSAAVSLPSCADDGNAAGVDVITPRDLYERGGLLSDSDVVDILAACPTDAQGPFIVRHADAPQPADAPTEILLRVEIAKVMTPASAACWRDELKARGVAEFEVDTEGAHYGTTTAGSSSGTGG